MKLKVIIGCIVVAAMLSVATPVLALSLGVSPTHVELEVLGDGSVATNVKIHYFSGDVKISLVDIPLGIEPSIIHVEASNEPVDIELTIHGNHSLDTQVYDGYIRFIAVSGGAATGGVQVIAKVTNIADGIASSEEAPLESSVAPEKSPPEESPPQQSAQAPAESPPAPPATSETTEWPIIPVAGIVAGAALVITLIFVLARRRQY